MTWICTGWTEGDGALINTIDAPSFASALRLVNAVARVAEALDHHPDIVWTYRRIELRCHTHETGTVTSRDHALAAAIDKELGVLSAG